MSHMYLAGSETFIEKGNFQLSIDFYSKILPYIRTKLRVSINTFKGLCGVCW